MNPHLLLILVGLFYVAVFGALSLVRREGLSGQFPVEALIIIGLAVLLGVATGAPINPILFFIFLYLVTMRARLLTDLANMLFRHRGYRAAEPAYRLALRLFPDRTGRFIVLVNWGIARLQNGDVDGAMATLRDVLVLADERGGLGRKYEAACRYNLAIAHRKAGDDVESVRQFNQVIDLFPASLYAQAAEKALKERRERGLPRKRS